MDVSVRVQPAGRGHPRQLLRTGRPLPAGGAAALARAARFCGVDLSLEVVYSGDFTVAELAKAIELKEIEQAGGDYQDLLRGICDRGPAPTKRVPAGACWPRNKPDTALHRRWHAHSC